MPSSSSPRTSIAEPLRCVRGLFEIRYKITTFGSRMSNHVLCNIYLLVLLLAFCWLTSINVLVQSQTDANFHGSALRIYLRSHLHLSCSIMFKKIIILYFVELRRSTFPFLLVSDWLTNSRASDRLWTVRHIDVFQHSYTAKLNEHLT